MGRVAPAKTLPTRSGAGPLSRALIFLIVGGFCACTALTAHRPSRRHHETGKTPPKPAPRAMVDPSRPGPRSTAKSSSDEIDPNDVVRISSNLVPIPASVVDKRGNAVVSLKLDDFELRVDGELRPLSDLTRSETSVRLAMLFDNSGSLDAAREFEKQAAIRFFRKVMRKNDEAAIYSIETDSRLAQPLTNDVVRLKTIAMFGK